MTEEQASYLNTIVKVKIAPSAVHGVGVFALRDIPKGQTAYCNRFPQLHDLPYSYFGKLFKEVREQLLERFPHIINGSKFIYPDVYFQGYMNHSDKPNYDALTDTALEDIKAGEEIFEDYRLIENYKQVYPWLD